MMAMSVLRHPIVQQSVDLIQRPAYVTPRRSECRDQLDEGLALVEQPRRLVKESIELVARELTRGTHASTQDLDLRSGKSSSLGHERHRTNGRSTRRARCYHLPQGSTCIPPNRRLVERRRDRSIAMQDTHDPFSFLLSEIRAHDAGLRRWQPGDRDHYLAELIADEAQEIAWGRRHLSVIHGEVVDDVEAEALDDIVCALLDLLDGRWHRFGGLDDHHFTLTVDGVDADEMIGNAIDVIVRIRPQHWIVTTTAVVEVEP